MGIAPGAPERPQLVKGFMQLYSVEQSRSQALEAHAAAFTQLQLGGKAAPVISFAQKTLGAGGAVVSKLHVIELGQPGQTSLKKSAELFFPPEFADDFPVSMQIRCGAGWCFACQGAGRMDLAAAACSRRLALQARGWRCRAGQVLSLLMRVWCLALPGPCLPAATSTGWRMWSRSWACCSFTTWSRPPRWVSDSPPLLLACLSWRVPDVPKQPTCAALACCAASQLQPRAAGWLALAHCLLCAPPAGVPHPHLGGPHLPGGACARCGRLQCHQQARLLLLLLLRLGLLRGGCSMRKCCAPGCCRLDRQLPTLACWAPLF